MSSCGEALIAALERRGVEVVFGIPGVHTLELYRGLARSAIRHVSPRHEQGAAFMAAGYARVSGRPGVCVLITGPGVTNAATGVASAYHDSQPVLVIASETASGDAGRDRGALHDLRDQRALMASITGYSETVRAPEQLEGALERAFAVLEGRRPRPAYVGVPIDVLASEAPDPDAMQRSRRAAAEKTCALNAAAGEARGPSKGHCPSPANDVELERAAQLLQRAQRPLILLGGGAIDAGEEALAISQATGAPIATTINGKGAVPERHPAALGATVALTPVFEEIESADVVLAAGTEFSELDYYYQGRLPRISGELIRIDSDPAQLRSGAPPAVALAGDARTLLFRLARRLDSLGERDEGGGNACAAARAAALRAELSWWEGAQRHFPVLDAIAAALPADAIVAADSTQLAYVANSYLHVERPRSYLCPAGYGTLGPALPMAIGARIAAPRRPVCCLIGDGGLLFTLSELASAAQLRIPLAIVLWNNHGYGEIADEMNRAGIPPIGIDASAPDFLQLARGLGCEAVRAAALDRLPETIGRAFATDRPTLIELPAEALD